VTEKSQIFPFDKAIGHLESGRSATYHGKTGVLTLASVIRQRLQYTGRTTLSGESDINTFARRPEMFFYKSLQLEQIPETRRC
jgi:hypothetical protein